VVTVAATGDADFVRVHDVAEAHDALTIAQAVRQALEGGSLYASGKVRG
jgi:dihydropteroate synthase